MLGVNEGVGGGKWSGYYHISFMKFTRKIIIKNSLSIKKIKNHNDPGLFCASSCTAWSWKPAWCDRRMKKRRTHRHVYRKAGSVGRAHSGGIASTMQQLGT